MNILRRVRQQKNSTAASYARRKRDVFQDIQTYFHNSDANNNDHDLNYRSMSRFSAKDAEAYERFSRDVMRQCKIIKPLLKMTPPDPTSFAPKDIMGLFEFAKHFAGKDELGGIGYIRIVAFNNQTTSELKKAVTEIEKKQSRE